MNKKFRFKLNLFDSIVLLVGLVAVVVLAGILLKPAAPTETTPGVQTVRYTVCIESAIAGTGAQIKPGHVLYDSIKNYNIGTVESVETTVSRIKVFHEDEQRFVYTEQTGMENVYITVTAPATIGDNAVILDGAYSLRVNAIAYIRGEGFVGYGPVVSIERGENE